MSNQDILAYFRKYKDPNAPPLEDEPEDDDAMKVDQGNKYKKPREIPGEVKVEWIDDSSCVIKFANHDLARSAYKQCKLTEARDEDFMPPLDLFLRDLLE